MLSKTTRHNLITEFRKYTTIHIQRSAPRPWWQEQRSWSREHVLSVFEKLSCWFLFKFRKKFLSAYLERVSYPKNKIIFSPIFKVFLQNVFLLGTPPKLSLQDFAFFVYKIGRAIIYKSVNPISDLLIKVDFGW